MFIKSDSLELQSFFRIKYVRNEIPKNCKFTDPPIITYKYGKNIGQTILNHKKLLSDITKEDIESDNVCDCLTNSLYKNFVDPHHMHVFTGNLEIINSTALKKIMSKGSKFRESKEISTDSIFISVCNALDKYCSTWAKKEKIHKDKFCNWLVNIKRVLRNKLFSIHRKNKRSVSDNLRNPLVFKSLNELQKRFIFTYVDKANNNFGIICKKYYIDVLKKELGINSSGIKGNDVYLPVNEAIDTIIKSHTEIMKNNFNIQLSEDHKSIPYLFWIPKLHKNPYKSRFIAGASKCTTKQLSVEVTLCLKEIKKSLS